MPVEGAGWTEDPVRGLRAGPVLPLLYPLVWYWKPSWMRRIDRKGQRCRIVVRGKKNSVLVEFEDGFRVVTSRYAVKKS